MRPYAYTNQPLSQHIKGVVEWSGRMLEKSGYTKTGARRLKYAGVNLENLDTLNEAILAAAIFHDVGKAIEYYQSQFNEKGECVKPKRPDGRPTFRLHEVLSAVYFDRFVSKHLDWPAELKILAVLAVLNHMHALRDFGRIIDLFNPEENIVSQEIRRVIFGARIAADDLDSLAETIAGYGFMYEDVKKELTPPVTRYDVISLGKKLQEFEFIKSSRLYVLLLLPVLVGDVLDASESRRDEETTASRRAFIEELRMCLR
jgi:CRISPR-associated endonuclease Cas3-HD